MLDKSIVGFEPTRVFTQMPSKESVFTKFHHIELLCDSLGKATVSGSQVSDCEQIAVHQPKLHYKILKNSC